MKIYHRPELDYLSLEFSTEPEVKTSYENGIIVRYDKKGHVVGIDITDSMNFFLSNDTVDMKQAVKILGSTLSIICGYANMHWSFKRKAIDKFMIIPRIQATISVIRRERLQPTTVQS